MTRTPASPLPTPSDSRTAQVIAAVVLLAGSLVVLGYQLLMALGNGFAAGCCGGHGGNGGAELTSWLPLACLFGIGWGVCLLVAAAARWRTWPTSLVYFSAVGLYAVVTAGTAWRDERDSREDNDRQTAAYAPWKARHIALLETMKQAIAANDLSAFQQSVDACRAFVPTVPSEFKGQLPHDFCAVDSLDYTSILDDLFRANAWAILDDSLDRAEQHAIAEGRWRNDDIGPVPDACVTLELVRRDDDTPWLMPAEDQGVTHALRETGASAVPQTGAIPQDMLKVLARHRNTPMAAGERALQRLYGQALSLRRLDVAAVIAGHARDGFRYCGWPSRGLVDAITPDRVEPAWLPGEAALFGMIRAWPLEEWNRVAGSYLNRLYRLAAGSDTPSGNTCEAAAARLAATRRDVSRKSLASNCRT